MRTDILERKNEIIEMINNNEPKALICRLLKCKPLTLDESLKKMNIIYKGNRGLKGKKMGEGRKSAMEYMKKITLSVPRLRKKLIEDGIKKDECEKCGLSEWMGQKISLELHHKDGNRFNNELENLEILCPNCHSLIPNHRRMKKSLDNSVTYRKKMPKVKKEIKYKFCQCGKSINKRSNYCSSCYNLKQRKIERPEINILMNDIKLLGYSSTGRKYGVSDNAIRKWIKKYPLVGELA